MNHECEDKVCMHDFEFKDNLTFEEFAERLIAYLERSAQSD